MPAEVGVNRTATWPKVWPPPWCASTIWRATGRRTGPFLRHRFQSIAFWFATVPLIRCRSWRSPCLRIGTSNKWHKHLMRYCARSPIEAVIDNSTDSFPQNSVNLSILSPRKIPTLFKIFEKAGGDLNNSANKNYSKDPRHLVLLKGFRYFALGNGPGNRNTMSSFQFEGATRQPWCGQCRQYCQSLECPPKYCTLYRCRHGQCHADDEPTAPESR